MSQQSRLLPHDTLSSLTSEREVESMVRTSSNSQSLSAASSWTQQSISSEASLNAANDWNYVLSPAPSHIWDDVRRHVNTLKRQDSVSTVATEPVDVPLPGPHWPVPLVRTTAWIATNEHDGSVSQNSSVSSIATDVSDEAVPLPPRFDHDIGDWEEVNTTKTQRICRYNPEAWSVESLTPVKRVPSSISLEKGTIESEVKLFPTQNRGIPIPRHAWNDTDSILLFNKGAGLNLDVLAEDKLSMGKVGGVTGQVYSLKKSAYFELHWPGFAPVTMFTDLSDPMTCVSFPSYYVYFGQAIADWLKSQRNGSDAGDFAIDVRKIQPKDVLVYRLRRIGECPAPFPYDKQPVADRWVVDLNILDATA